MGSTQQVERPQLVEHRAHVAEDLARRLPEVHGLHRITAGQGQGQGQLAQPEQRPRHNQPLTTDPRQIQSALQHLTRLIELTLHDRIAEAEREGWLGEVEGLKG